MQPRDDGYASEVIRTVSALTREFTETRQELFRAWLPLFPRITGIEKRQEEEAKERAERQRITDEQKAQTDEKLDKIALRLTEQDRALGKQDSTLAAQDKVLVSIGTWQRWRTFIEAGLIILWMVGRSKGWW